MGGIFYKNIEGELIQALKKDNPKKLKEIIIENNVNKETLYTKRKRTLVQLSCYYLSPKCLSTLIELNYDYNQKEIINEYSPLYIACKFNSLPIVKILLSKKDCLILQKTCDNYNEFEIAFLKGNYDICYFLLYEYLNNENNIENIKDEIINKNLNLRENNPEKIKLEKEKENNEIINNNLEQPYQKFFLSKEFDLEKCLYLQNQNLFPLFNMELFYQSLLDRVPPNKCPSFMPERKKTKELMTKIPDPNETWGHFFKRLVNFELYNPPLIDKRNVSQMNSMYMNAQMKLIESEYGIKMSYYEGDNRYNNNNNDLSKEEENEEEPIIKVIKNKKNKNKVNFKESEERNIIQINVQNSVEKEGNNKNEEKGNSSVRDKEDFYSIDVNNTSGRNLDKKENNAEGD